MNADNITKFHNIALFISISLSLVIFLVLNTVLPGIMPGIILGISLLAIAANQAIIYGPIARSVKSRNEELKEAQREAEEIAQFPINNPHPLIQITFDGKIVFSNLAAEKNYKTLAEEGFSHQVLKGLEGFMDLARQDPDGEYITSREIFFNGIYYHQTISVVTRNGILTLVVYCYDITDQKIFEKQLVITKEAAEVASRAKGDFLANMSHELRTPMNGIIGLSELLMEMNMTEEQTELAEAVNSSSRNLLILLNDILDLSKIEAGELTLENIPFDTRRAVRQTVDLLKSISSRKGVVLESNINPIVPERLMGDPARLQQIMNNLISNAIKFTEVGYVRIDVTSARDKTGNPEIHIRVEDTGIGIPDDKRDAIFQKFTQADVSTARKYGGTGLGLSITKELVEMMGGTISFDSAEGKGTVFYVEIPIQIAKEKEKGTEKRSVTSPINTRAKIMVVDDHPVNLLFMRKVLKKLGFANTDEAASGKEAIDLAEKNKYDLIFMDCQMPEIDGFEASTIIREREKDIGEIKIIAVTADAMKGAREKCLDAGMNDYISKPVDVEKLKSVLGAWIPDNAATNGNTEETVDIIEDAIQAIEESANKTSEIMDWDRLRMFTDGNSEEEKALIEIFTTYAEESLEILRNCQNGEDEEWKRAAHKLKGSAANLGAQALSDMCFEAERNFDQDEAVKEKIVIGILSSYEQVSTLLRTARSL